MKKFSMVKIKNPNLILMPKVCLICGDTKTPLHLSLYLVRKDGVITYKTIHIKVPICENCSNLLGNFFNSDRKTRRKMTSYERGIEQRYRGAMWLAGASKHGLFREPYVKFGFSNETFAKEFARINQGELS